jgi:phosphoserine aminotransferase
MGLTMTTFNRTVFGIELGIKEEDQPAIESVVMCDLSSAIFSSNNHNLRNDAWVFNSSA